MSRGHSPGCYCCNNIPPSEQCPTACCAEDESWPTFAPGASWQLRIRTVSQDCCCVTAIYDYIDDPVKECCLPCGSYSYEMTNESDQYAFKKTQALIDFQTQCAPPSCLEECCQTGEPILIATWKTTITDHFNYFFAARIIFDSLEIKYGKELIECPGDNEPTCRYFMKYTIFGHYEARVDMEQVLNRKRELTYLHPCWVYNENFKSDCTPWVSSVECEYDETVIHRCVNPGEVCSWPINKCCEGAIVAGGNQNCFRSFSTFCVERVKYFETPPSGQVGFTENDINTPPGGDPSQYCKDPYCDSNCNNGYISEIELRSGIPSPPYWYTNPPTVNSTSTTYLVEWDYCDLGGFPLNTTASAPLTCCDPQMYVSTQCPPDSCQNPSSEVTITCQLLDFNEETWYQEEECRLKSTVSYIGIADECGYIPGAPLGIGPVGGVFENDGLCYFPFLGVWDRQHPVCGPWQGNCIQYVPTGDSSCNGDCYATQSCGGCFCRCVGLFVQAFFQSNAVSFTTSGSWNEQVCNYTGFNLSISVNL